MHTATESAHGSREIVILSIVEEPAHQTLPTRQEASRRSTIQQPLKPDTSITGSYSEPKALFTGHPSPGFVLTGRNWSAPGARSRSVLSDHDHWPSLCGPPPPAHVSPRP